jgi:hypothetical protein
VIGQNDHLDEGKIHKPKMPDEKWVFATDFVVFARIAMRGGTAAADLF